MKRKTWVTILQLLVFAVIGVGIVWYQFAQMSVDDRIRMFDSIRHAKLWILAPVAIAALISHWARAVRWKLLLEPMDIRPTTINTLFAVLIGYLINMIPPRAGEVAKCTVLARYEKVPADKMIGTIVAERSWDVICLLLIIAIGLGWQASVMNDQLKEILWKHAPKGDSLALTVGILAGIIGIFIFVYRSNRQSRVSRFIKGLANGVTSILHLRHKWLFILYTILIWAMYVLQIQLGFWAIEGTDHLGMGPATMALIFGSFALIAMPGGLGLYPQLVALVLMNAYMIDVASAKAFGWVSWSAQTIFILLYGFIAMFLLPFYNRTQHNAQAGLDPEQDH